MRRFWTLFRFELAKAVRARLTWVTLLLPVVLSAVSVWLSELARRAQALATPDVVGIESAYQGFSRGASNGFILGGILLLFYSSMLLASEGNLRTWKTIMLRAHTRLEWVAGKFALMLLMSVGLLLLVTASSFLAAALVAPYGAIAEEGYVIYEAAFMAESSLLAVALVVPPLVALSAFGLMVSTLTDHTGIAASGCIGSYVFLEALKTSVGGGRIYLFNTFMPSLLDTSYFQALRGFAEGMSDAGWAPDLVVFNIATPLVSALVFTGVAAVVFGRRDFVV
jgi:ABC-type transport system involved in multi-copper enzyme maturation permease subunit